MSFWYGDSVCGNKIDPTGCDDTEKRESKQERNKREREEKIKGSTGSKLAITGYKSSPLD